MKLLHTLQIISTVSVKKCTVAFFQVNAAPKLEIQLHICGQIISVCNSERIIEIGQYLRKLCLNEKGSSFFDSQCILVSEEVIGETTNWFLSVSSRPY